MKWFCVRSAARWGAALALPFLALGCFEDPPGVDTACFCGSERLIELIDNGGSDPGGELGTGAFYDVIVANLDAPETAPFDEDLTLVFNFAFAVTPCGEDHVDDLESSGDFDLVVTATRVSDDALMFEDRQPRHLDPAFESLREEFVVPRGSLPNVPGAGEPEYTLRVAAEPRPGVPEIAEGVPFLQCSYNDNFVYPDDNDADEVTVTITPGSIAPPDEITIENPGN